MRGPTPDGNGVESILAKDEKLHSPFDTSANVGEGFISSSGAQFDGIDLPLSTHNSIA
jgi:hypothetical protein